MITTGKYYDPGDWTWRTLEMCTVMYKLELKNKGSGMRFAVWDKLCSDDMDSILEKSVIDASKLEWKITCMGVCKEDDEDDE